MTGPRLLRRRLLHGQHDFPFSTDQDWLHNLTSAAENVDRPARAVHDFLAGFTRMLGGRAPAPADGSPRRIAVSDRPGRPQCSDLAGGVAEFTQHGLVVRAHLARRGFD